MKPATLMPVLLAVLSLPGVAGAGDALDDNLRERRQSDRDAADTLRERSRDQALENRRIMDERLDRMNDQARQRNDRIREQSQRPFGSGGSVKEH